MHLYSSHSKHGSNSPRCGPCFCWATSILSYQHGGNRLPASTGGAEVTGGGREASKARGFEYGGHSHRESSTDEGGRAEKIPDSNGGEKKGRGRFAEGQRPPGLSCPPPQ